MSHDFTVSHKEKMDSELQNKKSLSTLPKHSGNPFFPLFFSVLLCWKSFDIDQK